MSTNTSRATAIVMISTLASRLFGFVRVAVVGAIFGASGSADVLNVVFNIPNNLRKLLAEGALSAAFIPVMAQNKKERSLFNNLIGLQFAILVPVLVVSIAGAPAIIRIILDFPDPEKQLLAIRLFRYLICYLLLVAIAAVFMGTLNANSVFVTSALAPLVFSVCVIGAIFLFHRAIGIFSMAVGVLAGGVLQIAIQVPRTRRLGYSFLPRFSFSDPLFRRIIRRWAPVVATSAIFTINQQVALYFASGLDDGSGSAMTNALVFWQLPFGVFSASVTTVFFPRMSEESAAGSVEGLSRTVANGLGSLAMLLVPSGIGLVVLGEGIISVAMQRGAFTAENTALTAQVLGAYSWGLFSVGGYTFLQRYCYATGNYRVPLKTTTVVVVVDIILSIYLKETALAVSGLAWANTIAFSIGFVILFATARRSLPLLGFARFGRPFAATFTGTTAAVIWVSAGTAFVARRVSTPWWQSGASIQSLVILCALSVPALAAITGVYRLWGYTIRAIMHRED